MNKFFKSYTSLLFWVFFKDFTLGLVVSRLLNLSSCNKPFHKLYILQQNHENFLFFKKNKIKLSL